MHDQCTELLGAVPVGVSWVRAWHLWGATSKSCLAGAEQRSGGSLATQALTLAESCFRVFNVPTECRDVEALAHFFARDARRPEALRELCAISDTSNLMAHDMPCVATFPKSFFSVLLMVGSSVIQIFCATRLLK